MLKKITYIVLLIVGVVWISGYGADSVKKQTSYVKSETKQKDYYRIYTELEHDGIPVIFDIVLGCSVRVTNYQDNDRSFGAVQFPANYMIRIEGNHGVMLGIPALCSNGLRFTKRYDVVPRIIWYEDADDWQLGIGYMSMDAYRNPRRKLNYIKTEFSIATKEEFDAFVPRALAENLIPQEYFDRPVGEQPLFKLPKEERYKHRYDVNWRLHRLNFRPRCGALLRYPLDEEKDRQLLRDSWPAHRPKYWVQWVQGMDDTAPKEDIRKILYRTNEKRGALSNSLGIREYFRWSPGTVFGSFIPGDNNKKQLPEVYPFMDERKMGFTEEALKSGNLAIKYDLDGGRNLGFSYCYISFGWREEWYGEDILPWLIRPKCTLDGEDLYLFGSHCRRAPDVIFEEDKAMIVRIK